MTVLPQRPLRGSRISTFYPVKNLPSLSSLDSAFQLQEYISLLIRLDVHDVEAIVSLPGKPTEKEKQAESEKETSEGGEKKPEDNGKNDIMVDEACWIYEQLRRLAQDLTHPLITMLQQECTRASCPEMKAGEWLYLCVAHGNEGAMEQCCAIDYILHTLDSATALLNTPRAFPSRLQIPPASHRHFSSLARRLGRIFAHAYFHHREAFEQAEAESSLYARFLALTSKFGLVPSDFLVIPQRPAHNDSDDVGRGAHLPRPLAASVEPLPQTQTTTKTGENAKGQESPRDYWNRLLGTPDHGSERGKSPGLPALANGGESPRKVGRSRTDTMVLHEGFAFAEEQAKVESSKGVEHNTKPMSILLEPQSTEPLETHDGAPKTAKPVAETQADISVPDDEAAQPTETVPLAENQLPEEVTSSQETQSQETVSDSKIADEPPSKIEESVEPTSSYHTVIVLEPAPGSGVTEVPVPTDGTDDFASSSTPDVETVQEGQPAEVEEIVEESDVIEPVPPAVVLQGDTLEETGSDIKDPSISAADDLPSVPIVPNVEETAEAPPPTLEETVGVDSEEIPVPSVDLEPEDGLGQTEKVTNVEENDEQAGESLHDG